MKKVLIANRGEIACRIMRTARRLGLGTVAVYSEADRSALHVRLADEAVFIGPAPSVESYLRIDRIIQAARETEADCIHPGYGFLAENAEFAGAVAAAGLIFIGPSAEAMRALGEKARAKRIARECDVPVVPGYDDPDQSLDTLMAAAERIGLPVMIKAVAGGGGRGMRRVTEISGFADALASAKREAAAAFGNEQVLIEKLIVRPRHIEVQVFGDSHGEVVHLFERDCTLQRRNQKIIEEAPAPDMSPALREKICGAAVRLAESVGYEGAGTVEFLVEGGKLEPHSPYYFIEMNTRLQVEHPVTEAITGLDLVEWQFRVAAGESLPLRQDEIHFRGHAIEARVCAEDPAHNFEPQSGTVVACSFAEAPSGNPVRVETGIEPGSIIPPDYDSLVAKLITAARVRETALSQLGDALASSVLLGPRCNIAFLHALMSRDDVVRGEMHTGLIDAALDELVTRSLDLRAVDHGVRVHLAARSGEATGSHPRSNPWNAVDGFQLGGVRELTLPFVVDGEPVSAVLKWEHGRSTIELDGAEAPPARDDSPPALQHWHGPDLYVWNNLRQTVISWPTYDLDSSGSGAEDTVRAPINGRLAKLFVGVGDAVAAGDRVAIVEAMKMEHVLSAPRHGRIAQQHVQEGSQITKGDALLTLDDEPSQG